MTAPRQVDARDGQDGQAVRWGVLSTAKIGARAVIPAIREAANARLAAIASRDPLRAEAIIARDPGVTIYGSYEALLEDPDIEAVYIPLPNAMHAEWSMRAMEAGKHVLCEKPLGITPEQVRQMAEVSRRTGKLLMEGFMYRFHPQIRWVLEQARAGHIGRVRLVRSAFVFDIRGRPNDIRLRASLGGGSMMDIGCYPLNFARAVFGGAPREVAARVQVPPGSEVEMAAGAVLDYGDGRMAVMDCSFELPRTFFAEISGDEGRIYLPNLFTPGLQNTVVRHVSGDETVDRTFAGVDQYTLEIEHFSACVRTGEQPFLTLGDALEQAETIERIYQAAGYQQPW